MDPCWLSGDHLGSKHLALWQVVSGSRRSSRTPFLSVEHRAGQSGNRPRSWFEFGIGTSKD